tara:strand:+ start:66 stop:1334 length:1269 start_codon:yes stop_codon:yes gene_type:complete
MADLTPEEVIRAKVEASKKGKFPPLYSLNKNGRVHVWTMYVKAMNKVKDFDKELFVEPTDKTVAAFWSEDGLEEGKLTKRAATFVTVGKNIGKKNETTPFTQALSQAKSKWMTKYRTSTPIREKLFKTDEIVSKRNRVQPMKMKKFNDFRERFHSSKHAKYSYPVYISPKLDGENRMAYTGNEKGTVEEQSVQWYTCQNVDDVVQACIMKDLEQLPKGYYINVEVYKHGESRQKIVSMASQEDSDLKAYVFDMFKDPNTPYEERRKLIEEHIPKDKFECLIPVESKLVYSEEEIKEVHDKYIDEGYEGAIIRLPKGVYQGGKRSMEVFKYVTFHSKEFLIVGFEDGVGSDKGVIKLCLKTDDDIMFKTATFKGYSKDELKEMYNNGNQYIGQYATVYYACTTELGLPTPATVVAISPNKPSF